MAHEGWSFWVRIGEYSAFASSDDPEPQYRRELRTAPHHVLADTVPEEVRDKAAELVKVCAEFHRVMTS